MGIVAVEGGNSMLVINLEDEKNSSRHTMVSVRQVREEAVLCKVGVKVRI